MASNIQTPRYTGLLLAGGQSSRMKHDKSFLCMSDASTSEDVQVPLFAYLLKHAFPADLLDGGIVVSARNEEQARRMKLLPSPSSDLHAVLDVVLDDKDMLGDIGPATGLLSVHHRYPDRTFVVLAVDFPQVEAEGLRELIRGHEAASDSPVTCFLHPEDGHPEPLMSVWTPAALDRLRSNAAKGKSGPCFSAKQMWKEINLGAGMQEGKGLVRPSKESWVRDTDTPEEWQNIFGVEPRSTEVQGQ